MKKEYEVFSISKVCMDSYKSRYDKAKAKKKQAFDNLNKNFVPGSPMFVKERDKITPEYEKEVEAARDEVLIAFEDALERTIARERGHAMVISSSTKDILSVLECIEHNTISIDEYQALVEGFGNRSYWIDRKLENIASRSLIYKTGVQPTLSVKLEILNELAENTRQFLNEYDGEKKTFLVTSSDKYIFGLEEKYTNGYSGVHITDKETAKRLVDKALNKGDSMERSVTLANMLRTSKPDMQYEILSLLAEGEHPALSDPTMNLTGVKDVVDRFRKENLRDIKAADVAMKKMDGAKSHQDCMGIICDNLDNRHFRKQLEEKIAATNNDKLKDSYETALEVKREKSQKAADKRE